MLPSISNIVYDSLMSMPPISISLDFSALLINEINSIGETPFFLPILIEKLINEFLLLDLSLKGFLFSPLSFLLFSLLTSLDLL